MNILLIAASLGPLLLLTRAPVYAQAVPVNAGPPSGYVTVKDPPPDPRAPPGFVQPDPYFDTYGRKVDPREAAGIRRLNARIRAYNRSIRGKRETAPHGHGTILVPFFRDSHGLVHLLRPSPSAPGGGPPPPLLRPGVPLPPLPRFSPPGTAR